jgi:hypothetical protein
MGFTTRLDPAGKLSTAPQSAFKYSALYEHTGQ